ncbi:MAG: carbamoyltransferase HypF [Methylophilaceae bacterium]
MAEIIIEQVIEHVITLPEIAKPVLATGAWFKNTLCVTSGKQACISYCAGDLDATEVCLAHEQTAYAMLDSLGEKPVAIVHDLHPDFHSSRFAANLAAQLNIPLIAVQHHHAHIAAICAEHQLTSAVLGLALDGVGLGTDGTAWGGELLRVDGAEFQRLGHLRPLALPGGDRAAREPWRMAAAALHLLGRNAEIVTRFTEHVAAQTVADMLQRNFNCPRTSSMGRLFDAAAGLLGICPVMAFEAQAAIKLETAARNHGSVAALENGFVIDQGGVLDFKPLLAMLADCKDVNYGAALFHATVAAGLAHWVKHAAQAQAINIIALGGGCFLNKVLLQALEPALLAQDLTVLKACELSPGDSAIALGQAWVMQYHLDQYQLTQYQLAPTQLEKGI